MNHPLRAVFALFFFVFTGIGAPLQAALAVSTPPIATPPIATLPSAPSTIGSLSTQSFPVVLTQQANSMESEEDSADSADFAHIETLVVTANRVAKMEADVLAAVTVITREEIERMSATTLPEILNGVAGLQVRNAGGAGKTSSIFMRGTNSSHVLILVDGMRLRSATLGLTAFEHIPLELVERIEIVRGARSGIYGSDAIGGVINIITRAQSSPRGGEAVLQGGSNHALGVSGGYSVRSESFGDFSFYFSRQQLDGHDVLVTAGTDPDEDGYRNQSLTLGWDHTVSQNVTLQMDYLFIQGKNEYDDPWAAFPFVSDREKTQQQKLALGMVFRPESDWELTVNSALSEDRYRSYRGTSKLTSFATKSRQLSIAQRWNVSDRSEMLLGVDYLDEWVSGEGVSGYSRRQRDQTGYFGTWQGMYYPFSFLAALRTDHFSGNDSEISGNLEAGFMLTDTIQVLAGTGRAFKQPTMNDLYYSDPWGSSGNPALGAETGVTRELAVRFEKSSFQLRLGVYENSIDDLIQWTETVPGSWSYSPVNIASAQIKGTELEWSQTLGQNLAWRYVMNRLKTEDELTGNELNRRSKSTHSASLEWSRKNWMSNLEWMYVGSAWEDAANSRKIPSYQLVNARLVYRSGDRMEWRLTLKNLLDEQYESPLFYQGESRQVLAGIRFLID